MGEGIQKTHNSVFRVRGGSKKSQRIFGFQFWASQRDVFAGHVLSQYIFEFLLECKMFLANLN